MEDEVTFLFQLGFARDAASAPAHLLTLAYLKELAVKFVHEKVPCMCMDTPIITLTPILIHLFSR